MYDTSKTIDLENAPLNGGILVKVLVLSIDPYLRRMMVGPDVQNFSVSRTPILLAKVCVDLFPLRDSPHSSSDNRAWSSYCHGIGILLDECNS